MKQYYIQRNNIFLTIVLLIHKYSYKDIKDKSENISSIIDSQLDSFVNVNNENSVEIAIDVEYFFLSYFGYESRARMLLVRHFKYFKNFVKVFKSVDPNTFYK